VSTASEVTPVTSAVAIEQRLNRVDWTQVTRELDTRGCATIERLLTADQCAALISLYPSGNRFRSRVLMQNHGYGRGEYQYFSYPLPDMVAALRSGLYPHLAPTANAWNAAMGIDARYPMLHAEFVTRCAAAGQTRPTPLLLRYGESDYNCLHQDLYGELAFPLQMAILLAEPGRDFSGGEFVLTEQRPRRQSRAEVLPLRQGDAVVFAVHHRPVAGVRRNYRVNLRHGVSRVRSGERHALGIIFHDAI